jgi:hypothetical protein
VQVPRHELLLRECAVRVRDKKFYPNQPFSGKTNQFSIFLQKNALLNSKVKIAEMLGALELCSWDVVLFSETMGCWGATVQSQAMHY